METIIIQSPIEAVVCTILYLYSAQNQGTPDPKTQFARLPV